jgi:hypothetical protein
VPASTNAVRGRFMMFPPGQYLPMCLYVQTSHVEVTLETLTVDRKFLISASSNKQNQIVPSPKDTARPSESRLSPCHSSECVSKREDSPYRSGRSPDWLKMKNQDAPAVKREEDKGKDR